MDHFNLWFLIRSLPHHLLFFAFVGGTSVDVFIDGGILQFVLNVLMSIAMCVALVAAIFSGWDYIKASKDEILESI